MPNHRKPDVPSSSPQAAPTGKTTARDDGVAPTMPQEDVRLPHERDQSSDSQSGAPRKSMKQAHHDLRRGLKDTDRAQVSHDAYQKQKESADLDDPDVG